MFLRLLAAFVIIALICSALVASVMLQRLNGGWFPAILTEALPVIFGVVLISMIPAVAIARALTKPIHSITAGAEQIAAGNYGVRVSGGSWKESQELAFRFNEMSQRLEWQFNRIEEERQQLRTILGGMIEGVVAIGTGQRVLFANEMAGMMLSFQAEQALGRPLWEMTREPVIQALVDRALKERQSIRQDIEIQGKAPRSVSLYVSPLETIDTATVILVIHDISELRRLEQLRQDFVANVSHELKTPLAVIKVCVENLLDGAMHDPSVGESFLTQISDQAERLHTLILDLISLARIESGQMQMDYQDLPVKAVVMDCLDQQRSRAEAKKITLQVDTPEHEQFVLADEEALGQILSNLIDNALKYTPDSGRIAIRWQPSGDGVELSVSDNGTGIPERDLPRIFERFYRVDRARSRELGGTGLGLAIVKHLVQTMKGTVKAQSELGKGSTFTIWLPRANA